MSDDVPSTTSPEPKSPVTRPAHHLESSQKAWVHYNLIPVVALLVFMSAVGTGLVLTHTTSTGSGTPNMHVDVVASDYQFSFHYTDAFGASLTNGTGLTTSVGTLWVPVNGVVELNVTSGGGSHGFGIPSLGIDVSASPGVTNHYTLTLPSSATVGERFQIICTVPCGPGHSGMMAWLVVTAANSNLA